METKVIQLTQEEVAAGIARIEAQVPGIREAYLDGHGDGCWASDVDWHPLCNEYQSFMFLAGIEQEGEY